jgi:1-acyl-sn-glycerol-3-phosphate acyltransferase
MAAKMGSTRILILKVSVGVVTAVLGTAAVIAGLLSSRLAARVAHLWGRTCLKLAGVPVIVEGLEHISPGDQYVIMANHESSLDILALLAALPASVEPRFLAKKSLFRVPFLGWAMRSAGFVPVDRDDRSTATATLAQALEVVQRGGSPLVFPEETWSTDGRLLPFARGGFLVALKSALSILPVGLEGPRLVLPPDAGVVRPRPVIVRIGQPVSTQDLGVSSRRSLMDQTRRDIDRLRGADGHVHDPNASGPGVAKQGVHWR